MILSMLACGAKKVGALAQRHTGVLLHLARPGKSRPLKADSAQLEPGRTRERAAANYHMLAIRSKTQKNPACFCREPAYCRADSVGNGDTVEISWQTQVLVRTRLACLIWERNPSDDRVASTVVPLADCIEQYCFNSKSPLVSSCGAQGPVDPTQEIGFTSAAFYT